MKKVFSVLFFLVTVSIVVAQKPCNRTVESKSYERDLIKEVCIPNDQIIVFLHTDLRDLDIDGDSIGDFIFNHRKLERQEMDTTFLTVYKKINDSTHVFLKTFSNLYPLYFYSYDYPSKDTTAAKVFNCYNVGYPLHFLEMDRGVISLEIGIDPVSGYSLEYTYKPEQRNWYLTNYQEWIDFQDGTRESVDRPIPEEGESIDEFSYQKYLCPEMYPPR